MGPTLLEVGTYGLLLVAETSSALDICRSAGTEATDSGLAGSGLFRDRPRWAGRVLRLHGLDQLAADDERSNLLDQVRSELEAAAYVLPFETYVYSTRLRRTA